MLRRVASVTAAAAAATLRVPRRTMLTCFTAGDTHDVEQPRRVTYVPGDGVGPEQVHAVRKVFEAMKLPIVWDVEHVTGDSPEVPDSLIESLRRNKFAIKGPLATPVARGHYSVAAEVRRRLDLFAQVTHARSLPGVAGRFDKVDIVVVRENTEGEYSGLEHEIVPGVVESIKVITRKASMRIAEFAFQYAAMNQRKLVTAVHKANIMKQADGLFIECCREVAKRYPQIAYKEAIVDAMCMMLVKNPTQFDVLVTPNLYGGICSNVVAGLVGGPGIVPGFTTNGDGIAVFEQGPRHLARDLQGKNAVNPTSILLAGAQMLTTMRLAEFGLALEQSVLDVLASGEARTFDLGGRASTADFVSAVIKRVVPVSEQLRAKYLASDLEA